MEHKEWDFDSGNLVLDFTNTAEFHASDDPDEKLESYPDLVSWSQAAGLLNKTESRDLLRLVDREPGKAEKTLENALNLREIIYRIISAVAHGDSPDTADLPTFNQHLSAALRKSQISPSDQGFSWSWQEAEDPADRILWTLVREAANLITSEQIKRVGECADDRGCGYLFIDTSRNHSRRWCSMEDCGNRAKAQRHYQKKSKK
jgi:predicted RNA-binding Zn ribbon-like protein